MKFPQRLLLATLLALIISLAFCFFFLNLLRRPVTEQIILIAFSTVALGYLFFLFSGTSHSGLQLAVKRKFDGRLFFSFLRENVYGIVLALIFLVVYIFIGLKLNSPDRDTTDNFLDADNYSWIHRIAGPQGGNLEMRGPHPFAYFIFRPLGWLANLFTRNYGLSAILLNALAGALCVFLAWVFIKKQFQDSTYAFLIASILGLSTAHIFFGSIVETYIFSAAALIGFSLLLQSQKNSSLGALVGVGLLTFGITITNFVQSFIGFVVNLFSRSEPRSWKDFGAYVQEIIRFAGLTVSLGVLISLIHAAWYPSSKLIFLPSSSQGEQEFIVSIFQEPTWKAVGRIILLVRTFLLYTVIAPRPYVFLKEVGGSFPRFNFFKVVPGTFSYSPYDGLAKFLVLAWAVLLLTAGLLFLWKLIRTRKVDLSLAFALSLLFNFVLHLNYGYEPFLYSPDWAYALIFFVALSLAPLAKNRLFQGILLIFVVALAYNQLQFIQFILKTVAPFTH